MTEATNLPIVDVSYKVTPAAIIVDMDALKTSLVSKINEQANTVVTVDNLKESKALAAEMNKVAKAIATARKQAMDQATEPLKAFESGMKELEKIATDGRAQIATQVEKFESETLLTIRNQLGEALGAEWDKLAVAAKFRKSGINDLVLLGSITGKGALTGAVKKNLESRAMADRMQQDLIERRLLSLENESYKAGLAAPLSEYHVATFLHDDEESYQAKLAQLMAAEKQREIQAQTQRQLEHEKQQRMQAEALERQRLQHEADLQRERDRLAAEQQARVDAEQRAAQAQAQIQQQQTQQPVQQPAQQQAKGPHSKCAVLLKTGQAGSVVDFETAQAHALGYAHAESDEWAMIYSRDFAGGKSPMGVAVRGRIFWSADSGM